MYCTYNTSKHTCTKLWHIYTHTQPEQHTPEKSIHSSPLRVSGTPRTMRSRVFLVKNIPVPRPYSAKWICHDCSFIRSFSCQTQCQNNRFLFEYILKMKCIPVKGEAEFSVSHDPSENSIICWFSAQDQLTYLYQCWKQLSCLIFLWKPQYIFF